ncbi:MAG: succinate dehydrogenase [Fimbriimonadaceae bacterium]
MATASAGLFTAFRENFILHKLHSLTGIIPIGFYMVQHLALNSFSLAGPQYFDGVIAFFHAIPSHLFLVIQAIIWGSILFHGLYGFVIVRNAKMNLAGTRYNYRGNYIFTMQRITGMLLLPLLVAHVWSTSVMGMIHGDDVVAYSSWAARLSAGFYAVLALYVIGVVAASWHLAFGVWNFCIRWGITVSQRAQNSTYKLAWFIFIAVSLLGIAALIGFFLHQPAPSTVTI